MCVIHGIPAFFTLHRVLLGRGSFINIFIHKHFFFFLNKLQCIDCNVLTVFWTFTECESVRTHVDVVPPDFEIQRQIGVLQRGGLVLNETRTYDSKSG